MELTAIAADKVKELMAKDENSESLMLRIDIEGFG